MRAAGPTSPCPNPLPWVVHTCVLMVLISSRQ